eukprot:341199-Amphidinium_carterae.1
MDKNHVGCGFFQITFNNNSIAYVIFGRKDHAVGIHYVSRTRRNSDLEIFWGGVDRFQWRASHAFQGWPGNWPPFDAGLPSGAWPPTLAPHGSTEVQAQ